EAGDHVVPDSLPTGGRVRGDVQDPPQVSGSLVAALAAGDQEPLGSGRRRRPRPGEVVAVYGVAKLPTLPLPEERRELFPVIPLRSGRGFGARATLLSQAVDLRVDLTLQRPDVVGQAVFPGGAGAFVSGVEIRSDLDELAHSDSGGFAGIRRK